MDSLRAKVDAATSRFREQYKAVGEKAVQAVKQPKGSKYHSVTTSETEDDSVFTIDETEDGPVDPSLARLNAQHAELLRQAKSSISSTESQVKWLREERMQHERSLQELHNEHKTNELLAAQSMGSRGGAGGRRCCGRRCRGMCVVL